MTKSLVFVLCLSLVWISSSLALNNGLAQSPPVGWTTGKRFLCDADCVTYPQDCVSEKLIKTTAQAMKKDFSISGMQYLSISVPCWASKNRTSSGDLQADPDRFPSGMQSLAAYIHKLDLKLGLCLSYGDMTNDSFLERDAQQMEAWGIDMVTMDAKLTSGSDPSVLNKVFPMMSMYLNRTGRPILFSCVWPVYLRKRGRTPDYNIIRKTCNIYQTYDNAQDSWVDLLDATKFLADYSKEVANYTGAGSWNYNYYTLIGNYGLSYNEQQYQLAMWSVMATPLFLSADLRNMRDDQKSIINNPLLMKIMKENSGAGGIQKLILQSNGQVRVWLRHVQPSRSLLLAFTYENISGGPAKVSLRFMDLNVPTAAAYDVTDVYSGRNLGIIKPWYTFNTEVNPTGAVLVYAKALP